MLRVGPQHPVIKSIDQPPVGWVKRRATQLIAVVCRTSSAKKRCRAQALLWLAEKSGIGEVADLLQIDVFDARITMNR
jgi:hypothetical protein